MYPVQGGTQKIEMGRNKDSEYRSKLAAAKAQADQDNSFMWGLQNLGTGQITADSRSPQYGNTNLPSDEVNAGAMGNFGSANDAPGNAPLESPQNQTGFLEGGVSSTTNPQEDPQIMGQNAAQRVAMLQAGKQYQGLNNRQQVFGA